MATQYKIVHADNVKQVETVVRSLIAEGWEPLGGVSVSTHFENYEGFGGAHADTVCTLMQAMVMREPDTQRREDQP